MPEGIECVRIDRAGMRMVVQAQHIRLALAAGKTVAVVCLDEEQARERLRERLGDAVNEVSFVAITPLF